MSSFKPVSTFLGHITALARCVSLSVGLQNTVEAIKMPFGLWIQVGSRNHVFDGGPDPTHEGTILRTKSGRPWTCLAYDILRRGGRTHIMQMSIGVDVLGHVDHGWRIIDNVLVLSNNGNKN